MNKRSCESINRKNKRNTEVVYLHEESLPKLSLYMLTNVMLIKTKHVHQAVLWLCLGFTPPLSSVHMN